MSSRRSRQSSTGSSRISDDQIIELVYKLQQLLPEIRNRRSSKIAERRKVVSSIKSSLADAKGTYDGGSGSLSDVDIPDVDKEYNVTVPSTAATPITDVDKNTPPAISQDFVESKREIKRDLADERASPLSRSSITASSQISSTVSSKRTLNVPPETPKSSQETLLDVNSRKSLVDVPGKKIQSYMPSLRKESSAQSHVEQRNENLEGSSAEANEETEDPVKMRNPLHWQEQML